MSETDKEPKASTEMKEKRSRGGDNGKRKPTVDDMGLSWCNCTQPNLIYPIGRGQAYCLKCHTPWYH